MGALNVPKSIDEVITMLNETQLIERIVDAMAGDECELQYPGSLSLHDTMDKSGELMPGIDYLLLMHLLPSVRSVADFIAHGKADCKVSTVNPLRNPLKDDTLTPYRKFRQNFTEKRDGRVLLHHELDGSAGGGVTGRRVKAAEQRGAKQLGEYITEFITGKITRLQFVEFAGQALGADDAAKLAQDLRPE